MAEGNKKEAEATKLLQQSAEFQANKAKEFSNYLKLQAEELKDNGKLIKQKEKIAKLESEYRDKIQESLSFVEDITRQIEDIPIVGGVLSKMLGTDDLKNKLTDIATTEFAKLKDGGATTMSAISGSFTSTIAAAGPLLPLILGIAAAVAVLKAAFDLEKETVALATNLDVSKEAAIDLHHEAIEISREINQVGINAKEVTKAMSELRAQTGYNVGELSKTNEYAANLLSTTTLLVEKQGLNTEEAVALNTASLITGTNLQNMAMMAASMGDEFVSGKELMQDIGKVSKSVLINFKNNPIELVKAVKKAKMLGIELESINDAGDNLLNIESSLQAEMQANILAGKQMNFNEARQAALVGDTAKLQEEVTKQVGDASAYLDMEPYKRKAIAEAAGLTVDQLNTMMTKQLELDKLGYDAVDRERVLALSGSDRAKELERIKNAKGEEAANSLEAMYAEQDRVDSMQKLSDIGTKLMDIMGEQLGPVVEMVSLFGDLASVVIPAIGFALKVALFPIKKISEFMNYIAESWKSIEPYVYGITATITTMLLPSIITIGATLVGSILSGLSTAIIFAGGFALEMAAAAIAAIATASAATLGLGALAIAAGIGTAVYAMNSAKMDDGVMSPVGPAGYSRVLSGPEGSIALNDKDTLVAGTDLNQGGSGGNNGEVVALLTELIAKIDQPVHINIGNRAVTELEKQTTMTRRFKTSMEQGYGLHG
jgi:hypothetical protein